MECQQRSGQEAPHYAPGSVILSAHRSLGYPYRFIHSKKPCFEVADIAEESGLYRTSIDHLVLMTM